MILHPDVAFGKTTTGKLKINNNSANKRVPGPFHFTVHLASPERSVIIPFHFSCEGTFYSPAVSEYFKPRRFIRVVLQQMVNCL